MRETLRMEMRTLPPAEVAMEIALDSLLKLPEGAEYRGRDGGLSVSVSMKGRRRRTVVVHAVCDSALQAAVCFTSARSSSERALGRSEEAVTEEPQPKRRRTGLRKIVSAFFAGVAAGACLTVLLKILLKHGRIKWH